MRLQAFQLLQHKQQQNYNLYDKQIPVARLPHVVPAAIEVVVLVVIVLAAVLVIAVETVIVIVVTMVTVIVIVLVLVLVLVLVIVATATTGRPDLSFGLELFFCLLQFSVSCQQLLLLRQRKIACSTSSNGTLRNYCNRATGSIWVEKPICNRKSSGSRVNVQSGCLVGMPRAAAAAAAKAAAA